MQLVNDRTGTRLVASLEMATTRAARRRGLLGRDRLEPSSALMLAPCCAVHTAFMRFPLDVVFLDRDLCVIKIVRDLAPWRLAASLRARAVVELASGAAGDVRPGDRLLLAPPSSES
jgi:hypothetical protein